MTWGLPPDSRCTTQLPNAPPGHGPLSDVAGGWGAAGAGAGAWAGAGSASGAGDWATTGVVLACRGATGAGGASCDGGAGILAGAAGTRSTCPTWISFAQRIWPR